MFTEYDEYEFPDLGPDFFFAFEGLGAGKGNAAAEFFRRCWNDLRSYTDDEFERTYHDFTHRAGRGGREGHGGRKGKKDPKKAGPADRGRRAANAETRDAEKTRERPRATGDGSASARLARKWILEHVPPRPAMVRRETREVTLRLTKNDAFPSFPIVGQPPIGFVRKFEVEVKKERDGPFPRETAEKDANVDAKAAPRSRASESSRREVFDASTGRASATVTVGGLDPGVRYRFRTRLGCGSEDDVTWGEPGVESAYATKSAPKKSDAEKNAANNAAPGRARSSEQPSKKGVASPHASPSSASDCAFAKKKSAAPVSSRETALAAVAAAEEAERAAEAAKAEKKRAGRLAAMTPGERAAEAAREEAEAAAARAEAAEQKKRADAKREKKRLAAARAAERERQERARAEERARELAEMYRAQFAAETAERDAQASFSEPPPSREQARAARAAAFSAAAAKEDARAAAALKAAKSADSVSQKAALEEDSRAAERISAALAAANEAARQSRFAKWDALWDASPGTPPSASAAKPGESSETARASVSTLETPVPPPEISAAPRAAPPEAPRALREKKIPCRYFCSGQACRFGDACRFAHDGAAASEAAPSETPVPTAARSAQALRESKVAAYKAASHAQRRAKAYKTKPCRHWTQKGTCARGEACGFIHEDAPAHPGGVGFAPRAKAYKTKPCRYWTQKGTCARGEACGFIHEDAPEHPGGVEPATRTGRFASHSATYCSVCRLSFGAEHELVEHLWSDGHRDRINDAFDFADDAA